MTNKNNLDENQILKALNTCYDKSLIGFSKKSKSCYDLANEYLSRYKSPEKSAKIFIKNQIIKCTTSGFVFNVGGLIALPIALPANITTVWYIQLRMIAVLAILGGFDPAEDSVQTLAYSCLTGIAMADIVKESGIKIATKSTQKFIDKKISRELITKINQKMMYRFIGKNAETATINLANVVPIVGGIVGGSVDLIGTKIIANRAYQVFIEDKLD